MKSQVESVRTTWLCLSRWFVCIFIMGAISPGVTEDLGMENSPTPRHWKNNSTPCVLQVSLGYTLQIKPNGKVQGVLDPEHEPYVNLTQITSEKNTTAIQSTDTKLFLCMSASSEVYASPKFIKLDCEWIEQLLPTFYTAFLHRHHDLKKDIALGRPHDIPFYLGMNKDGSMRLGKESRRENRSAQFVRGFVKSNLTATPSHPLGEAIINTTPRSVETTVRNKRIPIGCKGRKTKYCIRMRRRRKKGKSIKHAKRHRKCMNRRFYNESNTLKDTNKKLRRLRRLCLRIKRKRLERKLSTVTMNSRTSVVTNKPKRTRRRRPHRTLAKSSV